MQLDARDDDVRGDDGRSDEELATAAQDGDRLASAELARRYRPLVIGTAARRHQPAEPDHDDVIACGWLGLCKAMRDFETERGAPFAAYAKAKVRGEMLRWFRDSRYAVHVPRTLHEVHMRVRREQAEVRASTGEEPGVEELAEALGETPDRIIESLAASSAQRVRTADLDAVSDVRVPGREGEERLLEIVGQLPERDRLLLFRRWWEGRTQTEVAEELELSQGHVSRLEAAALDSLRELLEGKGLTPAGR